MYLLIGAALTAVTNANPNDLGTVNPAYDLQKQTVSAAWTTQANLAILPILSQVTPDLIVPIHIAVDPSAGAAVTYGVTIWQFIPVLNKWVTNLTLNPSLSLTGGQSFYIAAKRGIPTYLQFTTISSGTLGVYADRSNARVL